MMTDIGRGFATIAIALFCGYVFPIAAEHDHIIALIIVMLFMIAAIWGS